MEALAQLLQSVQLVFSHSVSVDGAMWLMATLLAYVLGVRLSIAGNGSPLLHPLVITALLVGVAVVISGQSIAEYQQAASVLHWMLGPATVALAVPMYGQWQRIRHLGWRLILSILCAGIIAPLLAWSALFALDAPLALQMTMLAKSITTPLAMETSRLIGGVPELAAVFVILTGIVGAVAAPVIFRVLHIVSPTAQGLSLGAVCHGVGTSKALHMSEQTDAMATLGLCVNGIATAFILPLLMA